MRHRQVILFSLLVFVGCLSFGTTASATIENLKSFKRTYPGKDPRYYSCKLCHQDAVGKKTNLNAYGKALQQSKAPADAKELTKADFRAIEQNDADGDGISNGDEINAGTDPGDTSSFPPDRRSTPSIDNDKHESQQKEVTP